jgi:hypothetical protein
MSEVDYIARLQKIFKTDGIIGFGFTRNLSSSPNAQQTAKEIIEMHESYKRGEYIDITNEVL